MNSAHRSIYSSSRPLGFTLIELMLVTFVITVITGLAIPTFSSFNKRQNIQLAAKQLKTHAREAQIKSVTGTRASGDLAVWGIRLTEGSSDYIFFSCPAEVSGIDEYGYDCPGKTEETRSLKSDVIVTSVSNYPGSPLNLVFKAYDDGTVFFLEDDGTAVSGTTVDVMLGISGFGTGGDEDRTVRVEADGNVLDFKSN